MSERSAVSGPRRQLPRSRGAAGGILLVVLGAWGALAPFIGPLFNFGYTPDDAWHWTAARGWLEVLPGGLVFVGGLLLVVSASRALTVTGAVFGIAGGAWFAVGLPLAGPLRLGTPGGPLGTNESVRALESLALFFGLGAVIMIVASVAFGRLSVVTLRDMKAADRREQAAADEREAAEREAAEREAAERQAAERQAAPAGYAAGYEQDPSARYAPQSRTTDEQSQTRPEERSDEQHRGALGTVGAAGAAGAVGAYAASRHDESDRDDEPSRTDYRDTSATTHQDSSSTTSGSERPGPDAGAMDAPAQHPLASHHTAASPSEPVPNEPVPNEPVPNEPVPNEPAPNQPVAGEQPADGSGASEPARNAAPPVDGGPDHPATVGTPGVATTSGESTDAPAPSSGFVGTPLTASPTPEAHPSDAPITSPADPAPSGPAPAYAPPGYRPSEALNPYRYDQPSTGSEPTSDGPGDRQDVPSDGPGAHDFAPPSEPPVIAAPPGSHLAPPETGAGNSDDQLSGYRPPDYTPPRYPPPGGGSEHVGGNPAGRHDTNELPHIPGGAPSWSPPDHATDHATDQTTDQPAEPPEGTSERR